MHFSRRTFINAGLLTLGAISASPLRGRAATPMHISYFDYFAPFSFLNDKQEMQGVFVDVLIEALQNRMQIPLTHQGFPWARAQQMVREGYADAFCTVPTNERREYTEVSAEPLVTATFTMFTRRNGPNVAKLNDVKSLAELSPFLIGHYLGSGWAHQKLGGMRIDWATNLDMALRKLAYGRNDVFIDVAEVIRPRIKELKLENDLIELPQVLDTQQFNLCVRKESAFTKMLPDFDKVIRQMRLDGSLAAIYRKFEILPPIAK
jgi:polar amino acid transport system substrate-binding protein